MIVKCAEADALRSAFPTHLGGLYLAEERPPIDITAQEIPRPTFGPKPLEILPPGTKPEDVKPKRKKKGDEPPLPTPLDHVKANLERDGFTEDQLLSVANNLKWTEDCWDLKDINDDTLCKWIANWDEIKAQLSDYRATHPQSSEPDAKSESHQDALFK